MKAIRRSRLLWELLICALLCGKIGSVDFSVGLDNGEINNNFTIKYKDIINNFANINETNINYINKIAEILFTDVDVRTQDKLIRKVEIVYSLLSREKADISILGFSLMILILEIEQMLKT